MPTSKEFLEKVSTHCYFQSTRYRFAKTPQWSKKYRDGQLAALEYIGQLCFHFLQEEKQIPEKFKKEIHTQIDKYATLNSGEYKKGLYDALHDVLSEIEKK